MRVNEEKSVLNEEELKLTKSERKRKEKFEKIIDDMTGKGYEYKDFSLPMWYIYVVGLLMSGVLCATFFVPFFLINRPLNFDEDIFFATVTIGLVLIVAHELIHDITWAIYAEEGFKSIRFGFSLKAFCPYCTCTEPLKKSAYIVGALMPTVILGFIPCAIALAFGNELLLFVGMYMILGGAGDLIMVLKLMRNGSDDKERIYLDHPYKIGFVCFERSEGVGRQGM